MVKIGQIVGSIKRRIGSIGKGQNDEGGFIYNMLKPLKSLVPEGEALNPLNMFGKIRFNWCGPYNSMDDSRPVLNATDGVCKNHDISYTSALAEPNKQVSRQMERQADLDMLEALKDVQPQGLSETVGWHLANTLIGGKSWVENMGDRIGQLAL